MFPNAQGSGMFASTQPMMQSSAQSYMQGPPPGYGAPGQQQLQFDPGFYSQLFQFAQQYVTQMVNSQHMARDVGSVILGWINPQMVNRDPNTTARANEFAKKVYTDTCATGENTTNPRAEVLNHFVQKWVYEKVPAAMSVISQAALAGPPRQNFMPFEQAFPGQVQGGGYGQQGGMQQAINPAMQGGGYGYQQRYAAVPPGFQGMQPATTPMASAMDAPGHRPSDLYSVKRPKQNTPNTGARQVPPGQGTGITETANADGSTTVTDHVYGWGGKTFSVGGVTPTPATDFTRTSERPPMTTQPPNMFVPRPEKAAAEPGFPPQVDFIFAENKDEILGEIMSENGLRLVNDTYAECTTPGVTAHVSVVKLETTQADDMKAFNYASKRLSRSLTEKGEFFHALDYDRVVGIPVATSDFIDVRERIMKSEHHNWDALVNILDNHTSHRVAVEFDKFLTKLINQKLEARFRVESGLDEIISVDTIFDIKELREGCFGGALREFPKWHDVVSNILNNIIQRVFIDANFVRPSDTDLSDVVKCDDVDISLGNLDKYNLGFVEGETLDALKTEIFANFTVLRLKHHTAITNAYTKEDLAVADLTPGRDTLGDRMFWGMYDVATHKLNPQRSLPGTIFFIDGNTIDTSTVIDFRQCFGTMDRSKLHYVLPSKPNVVR